MKWPCFKIRNDSTHHFGAFISDLEIMRYQTFDRWFSKTISDTGTYSGGGGGGVGFELKKFWG